MAWFSGIPRINNKVEEPDKWWDELTQQVLNLFQKNKSQKNIKKEVSSFMSSVNENKINLINLDSGDLARALISFLKPGRTTTLLIENKTKIEKLKEEYSGKNDGAYIHLKLKKLGPDTNKYPEMRLLWAQDYISALKILDSLKSEAAYFELIKNILEKIELAAFCKGGDRRARWTLDTLNPEYATKEGCHGVAARLTYFLLDILEENLKKKQIIFDPQEILIAKKICFKKLNDNEIIFVAKKYPLSACPMCLNKIELTDFFRNGRNDPHAIVFGHYEFRGSRTGEVHIGKNAFWIHRRCNSIQGDYTIEEMIPFLEEILRNQKIFRIDWEKRG